MRAQEVLNCSISLWYPHFKDITIPTVLLTVPDVFIQYLLTDGVILPEETISTPSHLSQGSDDDSDSDTFTRNETIESPPRQSTSAVERLLSSDRFKEFQEEVKLVIDKLGGQVFPKLNWSSPKDASWIALNNSLCCHSFSDICMLMKSSSFISHDLTKPFDMCNNPTVNPEFSYVLALREWIDINPSGEYRCFIKNSQLCAISQRDLQYFKFIETSKETIVRRIKRFVTKYILHKFPEQSFVMDIYIAGSDVTLVDFNPLCEVTDCILYTWEEISGGKQIEEGPNSSLTHNIYFRWVPVEGDNF